MKKISVLALQAFAVILLFTACSKDVLDRIPGKDPDGPGNKPDTTLNPGPRPVPVDSFELKVKAVINVGSITYDSIPAILYFTSWDSNMVVHQTQLQLKPGVNSVRVPKSHVKYRLQMSIWGISDERELQAAEFVPGSILIMGGSKAPKKLVREESFLWIQDKYYPESKTIYRYNGDQLAGMDHFKKYPQHMDLQPSNHKVFNYAGNQVESISLFDSSGKRVGITEFIYDAQGRVVNMQQDSYGNKTYGSAEHHLVNGSGELILDYLYDNGHAMEYKMKFVDGNKVEDAARTSTGGAEGGRYNYDHYINPYIHLNIPDLYFSYASKNNLTAQQKGYGGNIPSGVPYKYEYSYDAEGYPVELVKSFKNFITGEHLYKTRTVYTY